MLPLMRFGSTQQVERDGHGAQRNSAADEDEEQREEK